MDGVEYCVTSTTSDRLTVEECVDSSLAQSWLQRDNGQLEATTLDERRLCFEVDEIASGEKVTLETCDGDNDLQMWEIDDSSNDFLLLKPKDNLAYCIDHNDIGSESNFEVVIWQCDGSDDQYFSKIVRDI